MFRSLLTILVALPLLLPQGVCVCDFMQKCEACTDCAVSVEPERPTCGCSKHKHAQTVRDDGQTIAKAHSCHKSSPTEQQDNHLPCCPAKTGSAVWKTDTTQSSTVIYLALVHLVNELELPAAITADAAPAVHLASSGRPIYLTLLTLRI